MRGMTPLIRGFDSSCTPRNFVAHLGALLMHLEPDSSRFGHKVFLVKIFLDTRATKCWTISFSDRHDFHFFLQYISLTVFHICP